ncbi:AraC family transcriptional regulator [Agaribacter flavus]|uniref:Helix-turn-helix domain-containing protein n=1 Tax=Agaribacter flavus TaxID=1902781 RepID=A0ABV7FNC6_9ALTE
MTDLYEPFQPLLTDSGLQRFSFKMRQYPASGELRRIVHSYLQVSTLGPSYYPVIPDGTQALFVSRHGTLISGGVTQALNLELPAAGEYFGVRFYPGALRHLFKVNINEIGNCIVEGSFLPSPFIAQLHEVIYQYSNFNSRVKVCDQWLMRQLELQSTNVFDQALSVIYKSRGNINITHDLATDVGVSSRHLNRLFQQYTGFSTKSFSQIIRFQHASRYLSERPESSLQVALKTGYFDQSHLLKDFRLRLKGSLVPFFGRFMSDFYNRYPM